MVCRCCFACGNSSCESLGTSKTRQNASDLRPAESCVLKNSVPKLSRLPQNPVVRIVLVHLPSFYLHLSVLSSAAVCLFLPGACLRFGRVFSGNILTMPRCCATTCHSRTEKGLLMFSIPRGKRDVARRNRWLHNIGRKGFTPTEKAVVCEVWSLSFPPEGFRGGAEP